MLLKITGFRDRGVCVSGCQDFGTHLVLSRLAQPVGATLTRIDSPNPLVDTDLNFRGRVGIVAPGGAR